VCTSYGAWQTRPAAGSDPGGPNQALVVRVVYKLAPITPGIGQFAGPGGVFYLTIDTTGIELY
jgi:hypothetical protein